MFYSYNCECFYFPALLLQARSDGSDVTLGGLEGHVSRDCTMEQKAKSCYKCGQEGHIVRQLDTLHVLC